MLSDVPISDWLSWLRWSFRVFLFDFSLAAILSNLPGAGHYGCCCLSSVSLTTTSPGTHWRCCDVSPLWWLALWSGMHAQGCFCTLRISQAAVINPQPLMCCIGSIPANCSVYKLVASGTVLTSRGTPSSSHTVPWWSWKRWLWCTTWTPPGTLGCTWCSTACSWLWVAWLWSGCSCLWPLLYISITFLKSFLVPWWASWRGMEHTGSGTWFLSLLDFLPKELIWALRSLNVAYKKFLVHQTVF